MNKSSARRGLLLSSLLIALLLIGVVGAAAQAATPITIGQNQTGEISANAAALTYALTVPAPQNVTVQVFAITTGFQPALIVLDPSGIALAQASPAPNGTSVSAPVTLGTVGTYSIVVGTANGQPGQFLITVQPAAPLAPPVPLTIGTPVSGQVTPTDTLRAFSFGGLPTDALIVTVTSTDANRPTGAIVRLKDALTGDTLALAGARTTRAAFRLPAAGAVTLNYLVEVAHGGSSGTEAFTVCVEGETTGPRCPAAPGGVIVVPTAPPVVLPPVPTPAPTQFRPVVIPPNGACAVASSQGSAINVRSGPSTSFPAIAQLPNNQIATVTGRLPDGSWYLVNYSGITGWISGSVVIVGGLCGAIPAVTPTPVPPNITVTAIPSLTPSPTPSATVTPAPGLTLVPGLTLFPVTFVPLTLLPPVPTLNFGLPPVNGLSNLTSGFVPDPFTIGVSGGGPANVSYLGGGCVGNTTSAPTISINYTSGAFPLLRFYYVGSGDPVLIVNNPSGSYFCNNDSFGGSNPTIDFNSPTTGRYDVWVGTFNSGGSTSGTLFVTEVSSNSP